ncbi:amphi-Trp domain-containing protein [Haloferax chudinovii]|uniref:Amphi-Trp domain-containing protein n=1 Tax=Haloferax chudinovii TaxID=1109010 RepID=A0ABD5XNR9_9EURY
MVEIPEDETSEPDTRDVITDGVFEQEFYLSKEQAGEFLIQLGEQLRDGTELTLSTEDWELPFRFDEPVEVEVEFLGHGDRELEIELELRGAHDDPAPDVS